MKRAVICVEDRVTEDGRTLESGSVTWVDRIPIRTNDDDPRVVGYIENIRREGSLIVGDAHLNDEVAGVAWVGADMDDVEMKMTFEDPVIRFTKARLRGVRLVESPSWPECRIEES